MSLPPEPRYRIESNDRHPGVRVGAKVTYSLVRENIVASGRSNTADIASTADDIAREYPLGHPYTQDAVVAPVVLWELIPERAFDLERVGDTEGFGMGFSTAHHVVVVEWTKPGRHKIRCFVRVPAPWGKRRTQVIELVQDVLTRAEDEEASGTWWALRTSVSSAMPEAERHFTRPEQTALELFRAIEVYEEIEKRHPTTSPQAHDRHVASMVRQRKLASRLYELTLVASSTEHQRLAMAAQHSAAIDEVDLVVFITVGTTPRVGSFQVFGDAERDDDVEYLHQAQIIDWTDVTSTTYSGSYSGIEADPARAVAAALFHWRRTNGYPEGKVRFRLPPPVAELLRSGAESGRLHASLLARLRKELGLDVSAHVPGDTLQGSFASGGSIDVAAALDGVAFVGAVVAFTIAIAAPLPGSRVAAGLIWASALAGASASTVRIVSRHARDEVDAKSDLLDVLSIVSSVLMLPGAGAMWKRGATIALRETTVIGSGSKVLRMALVGQIAADGLQGALIAVDELAALDKVLADGDLSPQERVERAMGLITRLAGTSALLLLNVKGSMADLRALENTEARKRLEELGRDGASVDEGDDPFARGHTRDGEHEGIADIKPPPSGKTVARRPELSPEARAKLGDLDKLGPDERAAVRRMVDADAKAANSLFARFGRDALDVAKEFEQVWRRWRELGLPDEMLRTYHKHTGLHGVRYFAKLPSTSAGKEEMIAGGWACTREEHFHSLFPSAGHSVARHGPQVPDGPGEALELRVTTGIAPDGEFAPTDRSTRFNSFRDWINAHDSAYLELKSSFGLGPSAGPISVTKGGKKYPKADGYLRVRDLNDPAKFEADSLGVGYEARVGGPEHRVTHVRADGSVRRGTVYPNVDPVPASDVRHFYVTLGWTGSEWIVVNLYAAKLPSAATVQGLKKSSTGEATI